MDHGHAFLDDAAHENRCTGAAQVPWTLGFASKACMDLQNPILEDSYQQLGSIVEEETESPCSDHGRSLLMEGRRMEEEYWRELMVSLAAGDAADGWNGSAVVLMNVCQTRTFFRLYYPLPQSRA